MRSENGGFGRPKSRGGRSRRAPAERAGNPSGNQRPRTPPAEPSRTRAEGIERRVPRHCRGAASAAGRDAGPVGEPVNAAGRSPLEGSAPVASRDIRWLPPPPMPPRRRQLRRSNNSTSLLSSHPGSRAWVQRPLTYGPGKLQQHSPRCRGPLRTLSLWRSRPRRKQSRPVRSPHPCSTPISPRSASSGASHTRHASSSRRRWPRPQRHRASIGPHSLGTSSNAARSPTLSWRPSAERGTRTARDYPGPAPTRRGHGKASLSVMRRASEKAVPNPSTPASSRRQAGGSWGRSRSATSSSPTTVAPRA